MVYNISIDENAFNDIDEAMEYYKTISEVVKTKFYQSLNICLKRLVKNPYFQIRYSDIRCLPLKKFPYMIHYKLIAETKTVLILGLISTYRNPETSYLK